MEINSTYETEVQGLEEKLDKLKKEKVTALVNRKKVEATLQKKIGTHLSCLLLTCCREFSGYNKGPGRPLQC